MIVVDVTHICYCRQSRCRCYIPINVISHSHFTMFLSLTHFLFLSFFLHLLHPFTSSIHSAIIVFDNGNSQHYLPPLHLLHLYTHVILLYTPLSYISWQRAIAHGSTIIYHFTFTATSNPLPHHHHHSNTFSITTSSRSITTCVIHVVTSSMISPLLPLW